MVAILKKYRAMKETHNSSVLTLIHIVQYAVIGLSLALFYSLLTAFSDIISFGWSYLIATSMTTLVLTLYYKGILKNKSAWILGGFISIMYGANYIIFSCKWKTIHFWPVHYFYLSYFL